MAGDERAALCLRCDFECHGLGRELDHDRIGALPRNVTVERLTLPQETVSSAGRSRGLGRHPWARLGRRPR